MAGEVASAARAVDAGMVLISDIECAYSKPCIVDGVWRKVAGLAVAGNLIELR